MTTGTVRQFPFRWESFHQCCKCERVPLWTELDVTRKPSTAALVEALPSEVSALRRVTSTGNWAPCRRSSPDATTSISRSSVTGTMMFMSLNLTFPRGSSFGATALACSLPDCSMTTQAVQSTSTRTTGFCRLRELGTRQSSAQHLANCGARVRTQVSLVNCRRLSENHGPPKVEIKGRRRVKLTTVLPHQIQLSSQEAVDNLNAKLSNLVG